MAEHIFLYPYFSDELREKVKIQCRDYTFSYTDESGEKTLSYEQAEIGSEINCLETDGIWNADKHNLLINRMVSISNYNSLFGTNGLVCDNAIIGVAVIWTSSDSRQRNSEPILEISSDGTEIIKNFTMEFAPGKLRGDISLSTVLYVKRAGQPKENEMHLANTEGMLIGEIDLFTLRIDGSGSMFPVFEVYDKDQPLWSVRCDWIDPVSESFADTVSININKAHKNYKFIDQHSNCFCRQLLTEVMAAALSCIIETARNSEYWNQIIDNDGLEEGSVGQAIYYFSETLGWDLSSPDTVSFSARSFFDRRIKE